MDANSKKRNLGVHLEEQLSAFAQHLAVRHAAPHIHADRYVPKPLLPPEKQRWRGKQKSTAISAGHAVTELRIVNIMFLINKKISVMLSLLPANVGGTLAWNTLPQSSYPESSCDILWPLVRRNNPSIITWFYRTFVNEVSIINPALQAAAFLAQGYKCPLRQQQITLFNLTSKAATTHYTGAQLSWNLAITSCSHPSPKSYLSSHGRVSACGGFVWACRSERHPVPRRSRAWGEKPTSPGFSAHRRRSKMLKTSTSRFLPFLAESSPKPFFCHCSVTPKMGQWTCSKCKWQPPGFWIKRISSFSCHGPGHKRGVGGQAQCARTTLHHFSEREDCE